jgi:hypothetical protein
VGANSKFPLRKDISFIIIFVDRETKRKEERERMKESVRNILKETDYK